MPNWLDGERIDRLKVRLVNPTNYGHVGWLSVTGATLTENYYSDTRIQGTVTAIDAENYVPLSMVRIIHEARFSNGESYSRILGTFFALRARDSWKSGAHETTFELKSVLYGMSSDLAPFDMTIAKDAHTKAAYNKICSACARKRLWISTANDKRFGKNVTLEAGQSYLSWLHQLASKSSNRIDCDEYGRVTIDRYISPSRRTPKMKLPYNSPLVLAVGVTRESDEMTVPSRAIVTWEHDYEVNVPDGVYSSDYTDSSGVKHKKGSKKYTKKTEHKTITDYADVTAGNSAHISRRGFRVSTWHDMDDLGDSKSVAQAKAKSYLSEEAVPTTTWRISTRWFEVYEGDVLYWKPSDGEPYRKVLVIDTDKDLFRFTITLTLKEV